MAKRNIYRVQHIDLVWHVQHEGATLSTHLVKDEAVAAGTKRAKANMPSQLVVHLLDGTIEYEYTYGNDPFPPAG